MEFFDVLKNRCSVRAYAARAIENDVLERIVDAGRLAATARNEQPWRFVLITDPARIRGLAAMVSPNGAFMSGAAAAVVVLSVDTKYYVEDCSAATQNILLAATALGVGSCWIAGDKKEYAADVAKYVHAGVNERLVSVISLGYPAEPVSPKPKQPLSSLLRHDG